MMKKNETLQAADFETQLSASLELATLARQEVEQVSGGRIAVDGLDIIGPTSGMFPRDR
ncbi:hypothetical protein [Chromobacterium sp. IIBBL 290-4]|uniref:hypothetical protein n=1 Tax=Chromobacterium sp. IIBBL 290-4 TaxID=2953890 RepID=UPI0020B66880|nr:hypothetical protein [Chromobacterium sp. IIBBL 290-4]UTH75690.1 hypothetical protein NKT35_06215 [Chromobacterium sp. IIBBL 290-4]